MGTITDMLCLTAIIVFIVDISGFTQTWKKWLADFIGKDVKQLKPLKPWSCSLCMVWWACVIYLFCKHSVTLPYLAFSALLAALSAQVGQVIGLLRYAVDTLLRLINTQILDKVWKRN